MDVFGNVHSLSPGNEKSKYDGYQNGESNGYGSNDDSSYRELALDQSKLNGEEAYAA
jgi:hypothetical protein